MNTRLIKSIPQLAKAGLNTQAVDLINVVKASFDIPQEYKDHVNALPPHFVELMYNLFRDACYEACDAGFKCDDKAVTVQKIEMSFSEKAQKALEVLSDTAGLLGALRKSIEICFDCGLQEGGHKSILEQSVEEKVEEKIEEAPVDMDCIDNSDTSVTASIENDAIQNMINYVNSLNNADKTALVYALGLLKYVDPSSLKGVVRKSTTASAPLEEVVVPEVPVVEDLTGLVHNDLVAPLSEEQKEDIAEQTVENSEMVGIYSIPVLFQKIENIMKSHQFSSDTEMECETIDILVDGIDSLTIDEVCQIASDKMNVDCTPCTSIEQMLDCLDNQADVITNLLGIPATVIFLVKDNALTLSACFSKFDVAKMLETHPDNATTPVVGSHGRTQNPISLGIKKEVECLARMNSLSGVKMKDLKKGAPRMAQYVSALVADFRTGKICAWSMAKSVKKSMADLVESCYGVDAKLYYDHLKGDKVTKASTNVAYESKDFNEIQNKWMIIKQGKMVGDSPKQFDIVDAYVIVNNSDDYVDCEYKIGNKIYTLEEIKDIEKKGKKV